MKPFVLYKWFIGMPAFGLAQKPEDLFFRVFALSHVRNSPKLTDFSEISLVRYVGSRSKWHPAQGTCTAITSSTVCKLRSFNKDESMAFAYIS